MNFETKKIEQKHIDDKLYYFINTDLTVIVQTEMRKFIFEPKYTENPLNPFDAKITLSEILEQVSERQKLFDGENVQVVIVIADNSMHGEIFTWGNYGDFWCKTGITAGWA